MITKGAGFRKFGVLIITAGAAVGACSPIAPSVSKLSSADVSKNNATDTGSPTTTLGVIPGGVVNSLSRSATAVNGTVQVTQLAAYTSFHAAFSLSENMKPVLHLDPPTVAEFKTDGVAAFPSASDHVKGQESSLASRKTLTSIVLNDSVFADPATVSSLGLSGLATNLTWNSPASGSGSGQGHWELTIVPPNSGDAVKDMNDFKRMLKALQDNLVDIVVEFQAD